MTWEWSGDPTTSSKDAVRFLLDDIDESNQKMSDEGLLWLLSQESNIYLAAALACDTLAARYRALVQSKSVGGLSISYGDRAAQYAEQAATLRARGTEMSAIPVPISTAQSLDEKDARAANLDLNLTETTLGMDDNHGTGAYGG